MTNKSATSDKEEEDDEEEVRFHTWFEKSLYKRNTEWLPCFDGPIQTRCDVARVEKS